jgi:hypothetical protein
MTKKTPNMTWKFNEIKQQGMKLQKKTKTKQLINRRIQNKRNCNQEWRSNLKKIQMTKD